MMAETIDAEVARVAERIRRWRSEAGLTLSELAERSDLAPSTVQKVETAQMVPTVAVLLKLARGLGRRPGEFVGDGDGEPEVLHVPARARTPRGIKGRMTVERLSAEIRDPRMEAWRVTVHPGASSGSDRIRYDGEAIVVCERGVIVFVVGDARYTLRAGDTLHFKASIPHAWRNESSKPARFLITGTRTGRLGAVLASKRRATRMA